jgi:hypothetical protein
MLVIYEKKRCLAQFPDNTKYFKLTRKYNSNQLIKIIREGEVLLVKIKKLKAVGEARQHKFNKHHLTPRSKGGQSVGSNLLRMDISRHNAWHLLFGNLTLTEIIALLTKLRMIKELKSVRKQLN